ncbi:MAG: thioredoxin family protein [Pseudomonadota bacterium]|nr:thioredoxin family protein [Pseudomonadota bacterium]
MPATPSNMMPLGSIAPDFNLVDTLSDKNISLLNNRSDIATVIMFICNHCPYVKHVQHQLVQLARDYQSQGIQFIAISSNDAEHYPEDSPAKMKSIGIDLGFTFPYCYDETQAIATAYRAACTPDFYIFDKDLVCVYRGQLDDSRPGNSIPVSGKDVRAALDAILAGHPVNSAQKPSVGCNIKWKPLD